ncbi:glycosyltransferase family 4 protein [Cohnella mopanensis]|uniref:glycosyltransferase family 4 protein n=1 Tax=Cohnella mopanensis TaxID=2911966 RepID=UPI001EF79BBF|nr:glycosyltransferase family 4 protein [Cohnella mopanensis]
MMKVLFITNIPSPYRVEFFNELGKTCQLTVWFEAESESNRHWKVEKGEMNFSYKFLKGLTLGVDKHVNWSIIKELRASQFDVYVLGCYSSPTEMAAIQWLRSRRIPFLLNSDGGFVTQESEWKHKIKKYFISSATGWLSSGRHCTEYLIHYGANPAFIYEYPFASLSYSDAERAPMRPEKLEEFKRQERLKSKVVVSVGQFIARKGFSELLEASAPLDDGQTSLVIIGGGPLKDEYRKIIQELRLKNVVIKDYMDRAQLIDYYRVADLFVLPTHQDVWGLVINEAISFGLPIVTTTGAGAAYSLVDHGRNGFIVDTQDINGFVQKCQYLLENDAIRDGFGMESLKISDRYTIKHMAARHMERLASFLEQPSVSGDAERIG